MAYNDRNVTSAQTVDEATGPIWVNLNPTGAPMGKNFDPEGVPGWVRVGDASTDGYELSRTSDSNDKRVFGRNLGTTFSNFKSTLKLTFAAATDADVLKLLFGASNVTVDPTSGDIVVNAKHVAPGAIAIYINMKTDDGRNVSVEAVRAQPSVELTSAWTEEDIVGYETEFTLIPTGSHGAWYQYIQGLGPVTPEG